jgi:hypothetical protein
MLSMNAVARTIIRFRLLIVASVVLLTVPAAWYLKDIRINPDVVSYFPSDDPAVELFRQVGEKYGGTSLAIVALQTDEIFTEQTLRHIAALTDTFQTIAGVRAVTSLTDVIDIREGPMGVEITRLIDKYDLPDTPQELQEARRNALNEEMIRGRLLSQDCRTTLIVARLAQDADEVETARRLREAVRSRNLPERTFFAGFPFQMLQISEIVVSDLTTLVPISAIVVILALLVSFRSLPGVLMPLVTVTVGTVWTLGLMAFLDIPLTIISDVIPVILIAVGSAYGIHVVNRYLESHDLPPEPDTHAVEALRTIGPAVFLAGITTVIGFLSFIFGSYLIIIRDFGLFSSLGILFVLIIALTLVPSLLRLWTPHSREQQETKQSGSAKPHGHPFLGRLSDCVLARRRMILTGGIVIGAIAAAGIPRIERKAAILDYFREDTPIRRAERLLSDRFGGSIPLQILVHGDVQEPEVLKAMERTGGFLDSLPGVHNVQSVADLIEDMNEVLGDGREIPDSRAKVVNLWFLLEGESIMEQLVADDYGEGVIRATITDVNTQRVRYLVQTIDEYLDRQNTDAFTMEQTGLHVIYRNLDESIVTTLYQSLAIALFLILVCMLILLRSPATALRGLIPIVFALLVIFGVMGWAGLPLDVVTVLIGSVSIGIGIDYSIHFAGRYREERKRSSGAEALRRTMVTTGRAIIINMITVALGFLVLVFADLVPLQQFGALVALTMLSSATGALTLLPAALAKGNTPTTRT